jgi:hypothetical protein
LILLIVFLGEEKTGEGTELTTACKEVNPRVWFLNVKRRRVCFSGDAGGRVSTVFCKTAPTTPA